MNKKELGIYINIPFCKKKCYYCDFVSYANNCKNVEEYKKTVIKEIESYNLENYNITTIYIGGGTPSYIDSKYIVEILAKLKQKLQNNETKFNNIEITIEVNPGTITNSKIKDYKKSGINRISIGLQSTNNNLLKEIGRIHTFEEFLEAYNIVKKEFDNINDIERYKRCPLLVTRENAVPLEEDEYFVADMMGMKVITEDGTEFGTLSDVMETGANDVYVIDSKEHGEVLMPAIKECVLNVDMESGIITVHLMSGLI